MKKKESFVSYINECHAELDEREATIKEQGDDIKILKKYMTALKRKK